MFLDWLVLHSLVLVNLAPRVLVDLSARVHGLTILPLLLSISALLQLFLVEGGLLQHLLFLILLLRHGLVILVLLLLLQQLVLILLVR